MKVSFSMRGQEKIVAFLSILPRGVKIAAMEAYAEYLIGDTTHGLTHEPERVDHDENNPYQWQSEKQRRAFFATNGFGGGIPHERTHETAGSWTLKVKDSNWTSVKVENESRGVFWVQGDGQQRGHKADGWITADNVIKNNEKGAMQKAIKAVQDYLKSLGKK